MKTLFDKRGLLTGLPAFAAAVVLVLAAGYLLRPAPTTVAEDANNPRTLLVDLKGKDEPTVTVKMAEGSPTLVEFPAGEEVFAVHVGDARVVELTGPVFEGSRSFVLRTGPEFPTTKARLESEANEGLAAEIDHDLRDLAEDNRAAKPQAGKPEPNIAAELEEDPRRKPLLDPGQRATLAEQTRRMNESFSDFHQALDELRYGPLGPPATMLIVQMKSGVTLSLRVVAVRELDESNDRVVVSYDREQVKAAARARGREPEYTDPELGY